MFLPLTLILLFSQCEKDPEPVDIPDQAFLDALIKVGVDTNRDGIISFEEAEAIDTLLVYGEDITDLTGIEAFINLIVLGCGDNK